MRRQQAVQVLLPVLLGALCGGAVGLALIEIILSPAFAVTFHDWGATYLQQFLRQPVVLPLWLGLVGGLSPYLGGKSVRWLLNRRRTSGNQEL